MDIYAKKGAPNMSQVIEMIRLMQGNEAVAEGALAAGVRFFRGVSHYSFY